MKTPFFLLAGLLLAPILRAQADFCPKRDCDCLRGKADAAFAAGDFEMAVNKYQAWKTCDPAAGLQADSLVLLVFAKIKTLKDAAERQSLTAYANDLAYKSQLALRDGDRNTAFRLAEFACRYADSTNVNVVRALMEALYYNDNHAEPLPRIRRILEDPSIEYMAFSPDSKRLITYGANTAKIWDLQSGQAIFTLEGDAVEVRGVFFSADGKYLAAVSQEDLTVWDLDNAKTTRILTGQAQAVTSVAFSPDGKHLAMGSTDNTAIIWDLESEKAVLTLKGHGSSVETEEYYEAHARKERKVTVAVVYCVAFSPDGKRLATGGADHAAKIWDLDSGRAILTLEGHNGHVQEVAFSPDGQQLTTYSQDSTFTWNLQSGKVVRTSDFERAEEDFSNNDNKGVFSLDGKWKATTFQNGVQIWDLNGKAAITFEGESSSLSTLAFSPDGKRLAVSSYDNTAKIWDLDSLKVRVNTEIVSLSLDFSPDGKRLAIASFDGTAKIWDLDSGKVVLTLEGHAGQLRSVSFSPDGKRLATSANDNMAKIWDLGTSNALGQISKAALTFEEYNFGNMTVDFSPDGKRLATNSSDTTKIRDLTSGKVIFSLVNNSYSGIAFPLFSPDGKWLAIGSQNGAKIWDLETGKLIFTLQGDNPLNDYVISLAFSPDGKWLATGSQHGAKIWDLESGKAALTLESDNSVMSVAFSPDGNRLATSSNSWDFRGTKIWAISGDALLQRWQETGGQAALTLSQLQSYNLETLLDQRPGNEALLIATGEVWQLVHFAELYENQAAGTNILARAEPLYARADRLYSAALVLRPGEQHIVEAQKAMLLRWAQVCRDNSQEIRAAALEARAR